MFSLNPHVLEIHGTAKSKGWWDQPRKDAESLQLVLSELAEATEEVRNRKPAVYAEYHDVIFLDAENIGARKLKPEGEAIEILDAVIRLFDWAGFKGLDLDAAMAWQLTAYEIPAGLTPVEFHFELSSVVVDLGRARKAEDQAKLICMFVRMVDAYGKQNAWDMEDLMKLKGEYNKTRAYKHGGKAL